MTHASDRDGSATLLPGAHRVIRALDSPEGPFAGVLVTDGAHVVVRTDAEALIGWSGWRFAGSEHVAAPVDLVRREHGHDVLLPWCTERVAGFLGRRESAGEPLSPGECSTLLVSLLRALSELGSDDHGAASRGTWWLTDDGRPMFVIGEGDEARAGVVRLVTQLTASNEDRTLGRLLVAIQTGVSAGLEQQPRVPPLLLERWEGEMLAIAAPRALRREVTASAPVLPTNDVSDFVRAASVHAGSGRETPVLRASGRASTAVTRRRRTTRGVARRGRSSERSLGRGAGWNAGWGAGWSAAWGVGRTAILALVVGLRGRLRRGDRRPRAGAAVTEAPGGEGRARSGRRQSLLVAAGAAVAVLVLGALWPGEGGEGASGASSSSSPAPVSEKTSPAADDRSGDVPGTTPTNPAEGVRQPESTAPAESVEAAASLWREVRACAESGDESCRAAVAPGSTVVPSALAPATVAAPRFTLLDEYGDIAVLRLEAHVTTPTGEAEEDGGGEEAAGEKVVVLARFDEKWLVRDVYDVGDQP